MRDFERPKRSPNACGPHVIAGRNIVQTTAWAKSLEEPTDDAGRRAGRRAVEQFVVGDVGN